MANIAIKNTTVVKREAENLITQTEKIESVKDSIKWILMEIKNYWAETQEDQQAFAKGLEENTQVLENIIACNNDFSQAIIQYMEVTDKTSQTTI